MNTKYLSQLKTIRDVKIKFGAVRQEEITSTNVDLDDPIWKIMSLPLQLQLHRQWLYSPLAFY